MVAPPARMVKGDSCWRQGMQGKVVAQKVGVHEPFAGMDKLKKAPLEVEARVTAQAAAESLQQKVTRHHAAAKFAKAVVAKA